MRTVPITRTFWRGKFYERFSASGFLDPLLERFDDAKGSGWKRHEQFAIRHDQDIFCN